MGDAQATWINCKLFLLEDVFFSTDLGSSCRAIVKSLWSLMSEELVERVLLFLPASSQARFCSVCKRWRELMTTLKFRGETALVAFRRGYPVCILDLIKGEDEAAAARTVKWCKWRKVEMPGLVLPPEPKLFISGVGRLPFVGVACWDLKRLCTFVAGCPISHSRHASAGLAWHGGYEYVRSPRSAGPFGWSRQRAPTTASLCSFWTTP